MNAKGVRTASAMSLVLCGGWVAAGCTASVAYRAEGSLPRISSAERSEARVAAVQLMDGRSLGSPSELPLVATGTQPLAEDRASQWAELRSSFEEHARRAGFAEPSRRMAPAPTTPDEARAILQEASRTGLKTLLFVRLDGATAFEAKNASVEVFDSLSLPLYVIGVAPGLIPMLIFYSLPVNVEYVAVQVRGFLVDVERERVLDSFVERVVLDDNRVAAWSLSALDELPPIVFKTIDQVFTKAAERLRSDAATSPTAPTLGIEALFEPSGGPGVGRSGGPGVEPGIEPGIEPSVAGGSSAPRGSSPAASRRKARVKS